MPPSSLSPAIELLQLHLRTPGNLQPARCDPWFPDGWRVSADVMLHAEEILRASYSGAPRHSSSHMFLAYAVNLRDRNSVWECFAVLAGAYYSFNSQPEYYRQLREAYTDSTLSTLLAGTTAVATLLAHGEGNKRGHLLLSYLSTSPALFRWSSVSLAIARNPQRFVLLMEKLLDDGEFVSSKTLGKVDRQLWKGGKAAASVAPVEEEGEKAAVESPSQAEMKDVAKEAEVKEDATAMDTEDDEAKGDNNQEEEGSDNQEEEGSDNQEEEGSDNQEEEGSDNQEEEGSDEEQKEQRVRLPRKRALGIDTTTHSLRSSKRICPGSLAGLMSSTPRVKAGFSFTEKGAAGRPWGFPSRLKSLPDAVQGALEKSPTEERWLAFLRRLYRSEPNCWQEFESRLVSTAKNLISPFSSEAEFDSVVALFVAIRRARADEPLRMVDLCCGIGGFSIAFHQALEEVGRLGSTELALDKEQRCIDVYHHNFPSTRTLTTDIHTCDWSDTDAADLVCCGISCQNWSEMQQARVGLVDDDPVHALVRLAKSPQRPRAFILECVDGMVAAHKEDFNQIGKWFGEAKYHQFHIVYNAADWGLPAERKRVYIVLFREKAEFVRFNAPEPPCPGQKTDFKTVLIPEKDIPDDDACWIPHEEPRRYPGIHCGKDGEEPTSVRDPDPDKPGQMYNHDQQRTDENWRLKEGTAMCLLHSWDHPSNRPVVLDDERWRLLKAREMARMQGFPEWFTFPDFYERKKGREGRLQLRAERSQLAAGVALPKTLTQENAECGLLGQSIAIPVVKSIIQAVLGAFIYPEEEEEEEL